MTGWLSLSESRAGQGALRVLPCLKEATAYFYLRPFCDDVDASDFPGAYPGKGQDINPVHHRPLCDAMVSIPKVCSLAFLTPDHTRFPRGTVCSGTVMQCMQWKLRIVVVVMQVSSLSQQQPGAV